MHTEQGKTVLGNAAKTIPEDLIVEIMDICRFHAKLPIAECPIRFSFNPSQRKQMLSALLRFADELDVDGHRISLDTVHTFRVEPANALYWWLHSRTKVIFTARNVVLINVRLHPEDVLNYGEAIHSVFIREFHSKNRPVLSVLDSHHIPITISADSGIVEDEHASPLPREITRALRSLAEPIDPLTDLADELRTWLRALRYEVGDRQRKKRADNRHARKSKAGASQTTCSGPMHWGRNIGRRRRWC